MGSRSKAQIVAMKAWIVRSFIFVCISSQLRAEEYYDEEYQYEEYPMEEGYMPEALQPDIFEFYDCNEETGGCMEKWIYSDFEQIYELGETGLKYAQWHYASIIKSSAWEVCGAGIDENWQMDFF